MKNTFDSEGQLVSQLPSLPVPPSSSLIAQLNFIAITFAIEHTIPYFIQMYLYQIKYCAKVTMSYKDITMNDQMCNDE